MAVMLRDVKKWGLFQSVRDKFGDNWHGLFGGISTGEDAK
jgi:hypothetical protein